MLIQNAPLEVSRDVAKMLLEIKAIKLNKSNPFTWASGWKSPIYCDNRKSLSYSDVRTYIKKALCKEIRLHYPNVEVIAGVATAGIPQGALVADEMGLPFVYVRSKPKGHGMENLIEGELNPESKVVVIEDLVSTGGSSLKAVDDIKKMGAEVLGMAAIFTYGFPLAQENFSKANIPLVTLSNYSDMLDIAVKQNYISSQDLSSLSSWRENPSVWSA
ncbi:MAG: orotate phosphoribosyltransferase [Cyclobacteriaceae bacterium]|nr:orotate phosphoribosyltransferase [Cyclobacteriaceae bacterium]